MSDEKNERQSRRGFLKGAGAAAPAAAAALIAGDAAAGASEPRGDRLQRTEHVAKYLESARF